jgi:transcriptional regulator with XRE-family HTH domain
VGRTIKVLRTDHGLGRKELAERVGISYSYLTEIENGNKPPSNTILGAIAAVLGVQLHELIADAEERVPPMETQADLMAPSSPPPWRAMVGDGPAPPSVRRQRAQQSWAPSDDEEAREDLQPTYPSRRYNQDRSAASGTLWEVQDLMDRLSPEDLERVLDLVRRLAR